MTLSFIALFILAFMAWYFVYRIIKWILDAIVDHIFFGGR